MNFDLTFEQNETEFNLEFGEVTEGREYEIYSGVYSVTPKVTEQTLETKSRLCTKDIQIDPIPYYEVENINHGNTAIIGG